MIITGSDDMDQQELELETRLPGKWSITKKSIGARHNNFF